MGGSKFRSSSSKFRELELANFRARSRLYRSQILQVNTRWKALAEIYTMHSFAPFSNLKIFVKNYCFFSAFFPKIRKICQNFAEFSPNVTKFFRDFSKMQHFSKIIFKMCNIFLGIFSKKCRFFRKKAEFSGHETAKKVIVSITYRASCSEGPTLRAEAAALNRAAVR